MSTVQQLLGCYGVVHGSEGFVQSAGWNNCAYSARAISIGQKSQKIRWRGGIASCHQPINIVIITFCPLHNNLTGNMQNA
eukprot:scaffold64632_cov25-Prasinocladus_malaysianus.AAC.3